MNDQINSNISENATKVIEILKSNSGKMSSWDIKMKLGFSSSVLYMTIGYLIANGKVNVYQKDLLYIIELINS
jgi:predicted RNA-binding protein (virulence factor B family)